MTPTTYARTSDVPCGSPYPQSQQAHYARAIFKRPKLTRKALRRNELLRSCQHTAKAKLNALRLTRRLRKRRHTLLSLLPYSCGRHGRFAIPCYVIAKESRFKCTAQNPTSTAYGFYQLLDTWWPRGAGGKRRPTCTEQHRIAARLWNGGKGWSNWALTV